MDIFTLVIVGLVAGLLAAKLVRGAGYGMLGDIVLGIIGAFVGGWAFHRMGWRAPFEGLAGGIAVAALGSVAVLAVGRLVARSGFRGPRA